MRTLDLNCPVCGDVVTFRVDAALVRVDERISTYTDPIGHVIRLTADVDLSARHSCRQTS